MNWISEMMAFYDWLQTKQDGLPDVPPGAQALWHALMYWNNRCAVKCGGNWYWRVYFRADNGMLLSILKFSRQQLDNMRNILIQTGRIEYRKSGRRNQSGTYKIIPFGANYLTQELTQDLTQELTQVWTQELTHGLHNSGTVVNNKYNIINTCGDDGARACAREQQLYQTHFGCLPTEAEAAQCRRWLAEYGDDMVEHAFYRAGMSGNKNAAYAGGILKNIRQRGITDFAGLALDDMQHG